MRKKSSILNMITAYLGQFSAAIISLVARLFFVRILGREYLGINGLFANVLTLLSLVELGVGPAIIYCLYKPIADEDHEKIKSLMALFQKVYVIIGVIILILGLSLTPFLSIFIKEMPNIPYLKLIYCLFVLNSSISYFFSYKKSLINADKYRYILPIYKYSIYLVTNVLQVIFLIVTKNYIVFLILQVISTLTENILVSRRADKMYPYLKDKNIKKLDTETSNSIMKNTKAMIGHKLGGIIVRSTDNILISKIIGLVAVGLYSNYLLIINALDAISNQVFNSITASAGNLCVSSDKEQSNKIFKAILFANFMIYIVFSTVLLTVFNPFIELWLGKDMLFNTSIVIVIVLNFYLTGMRKSVLLFRDAMGLYYEDRIKPFIESIINLVMSIILAYKYGVIGVFIGTTISTVTTCLWLEPWILYKYGFKKPVGPYFKTYFVYTLISFISVGLSYYLCSFITIIGLLGILLKLLISLIISILFILLFRKTDEFNYIFSVLKQTKKILKK